ncbi:hypothetical protein [Brachybacterium saurashtrense]|uniref:hypothetical protein n=1 Tax=Brachybacterium saurashtrense TaxID=556288 RepID=UPI0013B3E7D1|nr:hypothetical protein [Brachybacterium saurashtrense]
MTFLRSLSSALGRMSERMQGQDVERGDLVSDHRLGANYAAVVKARSSQGISSIGLGR